MRITIKKQFESNEFNYTGHIEFILDSFKEYVKITQKEISVIESRLKEIDSLSKKFGSEFDFDLLYDSSEQIYIERNITQIYYESIFIAIYSFVEKTMKKLCLIARDNSIEKNQITLNDISHNGIELYYIYLKKVQKMNLDHLNMSWNMLKSFNKLRNLIIHDPSREIEIKSNAKTIVKLEDIKNLTKEKDNDIFKFSIDNKELLDDFISTAEDFFKNLCYN